MIYLSRFEFPGEDEQYRFVLQIKRKCYNSFYPFRILSKDKPVVFDFEPITILYGGNGSGKTTALNTIAEKLILKRDTLYNRTSFFGDFTDMCTYVAKNPIPEASRIVTSDDVFDFMLNLRTLNDGISAKREELFEDYLDAKYSKFRMNSLDDYEELKKVNMSRSRTQSRYVRENVMGDVREHSNGESALIYFIDKIKEEGLYLLDEPENSLSPEKQQELLKYIEDSARFFGSQFIIATHSPFILSIKNAKIYDMDDNPVVTKKWTELPNVLSYYRLFKKHQREFE